MHLTTLNGRLAHIYIYAALRVAEVSAICKVVEGLQKPHRLITVTQQSTIRLLVDIYRVHTVYHHPPPQNPDLHLISEMVRAVTDVRPRNVKAELLRSSLAPEP